MRYHVGQVSYGFYVFDYETPGPRADVVPGTHTYRRDTADVIAETLEQEHREQQQRDSGQDVSPRPVVIMYDNLVPHFEEQPPAWEHTGTPAVVIIDASNPDHWQRYVWSYARESPELRAEIQQARVPARSNGYEIGYYPLDTSDDIAWEMIPDGPYCAACIDPINNHANANPAAPHDYPQAFHAEQIEQGEEVSNEPGEGYTYGNVHCAGCGEVLYDAYQEL